MSTLLAIETSQRLAGVALRDHSGNILEEPLSPRKRHDDDLMPAIDRLFKRAELSPRNLHAVGVSIGPGGFTGLRIAVTTAKMLAETLTARIVAVPSALVAAESTIAPDGVPAGSDIIVALASKGESAWCTRCRPRVDGWTIAAAPGLRDAASLELDGVATLLGDEYLPQPLRIRCEQLGVTVIQPRFDPKACLMIAARMLQAGDVTDPLLLEPLYPREPEAVTIWERRHSGTAPDGQQQTAPS